MVGGVRILLEDPLPKDPVLNKDCTPGVDCSCIGDVSRLFTRSLPLTAPSPRSARTDGQVRMHSLEITLNYITFITLDAISTSKNVVEVMLSDAVKRKRQREKHTDIP